MQFRVYFELGRVVVRRSLSSQRPEIVCVANRTQAFLEVYSDHVRSERILSAETQDSWIFSFGFSTS